MGNMGLKGFWVVCCVGVAFTQSARATSAEQQQQKVQIQKKSYIRLYQTGNEEKFDAVKQSVLESKRRGLIQDIKRFLAEARSLDQKTELNLRLAALYMEDYFSGLAKSQAKFAQDYMAYEKSGKKGPAPKENNAEALASLESARSIYKFLVKRFPDHPRADEMLYSLALSSSDQGMSAESISYFQKLIDRHKNSKFADEALVQLGDYYFENNKFPVAESYYDKTIQRKNPRVLAYAVYKKGWCAYNQQKPGVALQHFKWVIDNEDRIQNGAQGGRVKNEALRDIVLPYVDMKMVDEPIAFFKSQGDAQNRRGIEAIAQLYYERGVASNAIKFYSLLLDMDPNHPKAPTYEINIVESLRLAQKPGMAIQRLFARIPAYANPSNWYEINSANPKVVQESTKLFEDTAHKYALEIHAEAQKMKNTERYELAKQLYSKFIETFPKSERIGTLRFYLAEILFKQEAYLPAAGNYLEAYKHPGIGALKFEAIRNSIAAFHLILNKERKAQGVEELSAKSANKIGKQDSSEVLPYSDLENRFLEVAAEFQAQYPKAKETPDILFETSYLAYQHHDFAKAFKGFNEILASYPKQDTVYTSAGLILDILNRGGDYPRLIATAQAFLKTPTLTKPEFRADVANILRHAELKRIALIEEKKDYRKAADEYVEFTKAYGAQDEGLFETALFNASINYTKAEDFLAAVESQERFLRRFPKSPHRQDMLLQVAKTYELMANFEKAAQYFESFAENYINHPQAKNALRIAGLYYWGAGQNQKAENVMLGYAKRFPQDSAVIERDLVDLYENTGDTEKLLNYYQRARFQKGVTYSQHLASTLRVIELYQAQTGKLPVQVMNEALKVASTHSKDIASTPKGAEALAKLLFWENSQREAEFYRIRLALPQAGLQRNMERKLALIKDIEKAYERVVAVGNGEWGLGAIAKASEAYLHLAQSISHAPVPPELTGPQIEQYRSEVEKQMVKPLLEKAQGLANRCLDKSQEFNLLSSWTSRCYSLMASMDPARYPMVRTFYLPPLRLAMFKPEGDSKIEVGEWNTNPYPYDSTALYGYPTDRSLASVTANPETVLFGMRTHTESAQAAPHLITYRQMTGERVSLIKNLIASQKPRDLQKNANFSFLSSLRLIEAKKALPLILSSLEKDPNNTALHNLLGLCYFEMGNRVAAKVTWLALIARGVQKSAVYNNLGVLLVSEGKTSTALEYFQKATEGEAAPEPSANLGFIALKYRNGFEAKRNFDKALEAQSSDLSSRTGLAVALIQNRRFDEARRNLVELSSKAKHDPYARLALSYFLIDVEKENGLAKQLLSEYMSQHGTENDVFFRDALQESRQAGREGTGNLPEIE